MVPVIVIVGRPNVGKSTLYNRLTKSKDALVMDRPGVTRDSQYGRGRIGDVPYWIVDTAGIEEALAHPLDQKAAEAAWKAIAEADGVIFLVDAKSGLTPADEHLAQRLRETHKPLIVAVNKIDGHDAALVTAEFHQLGFKMVQGIAANTGRGLYALMQEVLAPYQEEIPEEPLTLEEESDTAELVSDDATPPKPIKVAIIGRPNVGKSTLMNRLLGEERVVAFDAPGTTRDSISIAHEHHGQSYELIDTAGIRRRKSITDKLETFAVIKALQSIEASNVVLLIIDAAEGIVDKDLDLLETIIEAGKALVIALNKWDGLDTDQKEDIKRDLKYKLRFCNYAKIYFISAKYGTNVGHLLPEAKKAYDSAMRVFNTKHLTTLLEQAVTAQAPPRHQGRAVKLRYAHCGGHNPPIIVIHGNQTESISDSYTRYLSHFYQKALKLVGTPVRIVFRTSENPYAGQRNPLTPRQRYKRERVIQHRKSMDKKKKRAT